MNMTMDVKTMLSVEPLFLVSAILIGIIVRVIAQAGYNLYFHPLRSYPGPYLARATCLYSMFWEFQGVYHLKAKEWHDRYGDVVRTGPNDLSYISSPAWKDICGFRAGKEKTFEKDQRWFNKLPNGEYNIVGANGAHHRRLRRLLAHAFSDRALKDQETVLEGYTDLFISQLRERAAVTPGAVDLVRWFGFATFDVIGDLAFGESFHLLENGIWHRYVSSIFGFVRIGNHFRAVKRLIPASLQKLVLLFILPNDLRAAMMDQYNFARDTLTRRMELGVDREDFISRILKGSKEQIGEEGLSFEEIVPQAQVLLTAGSETTATLLSGLTYLLLKNPESMKRLVEEIRSSFATDKEIHLATVPQLPFLHAVLEESLRMYPPLPNALPRITPVPGEVVCGRFVPGGTSVGLHHYACYRSKRNFHEPNAFHPERWLNEDPRFQADEKLAFHPFSHGPRNCIGKNLAYAEVRLIVCKLFWNFDLQLLPESEDWMDQKTYQLWEKKELHMKLIPVAQKLI